MVHYLAVSLTKDSLLGVPAWDLLGGEVREKIKVYPLIGGERASQHSRSPSSICGPSANLASPR